MLGSLAQKCKTRSRYDAARTASHCTGGDISLTIPERVQNLQAYPPATHRSGYSTCRTHLEDSYVAVHGYPDLTSVWFPEPAWRIKRPTHCQDFCTDGEEMTDLEDSVSICNVIKIQLTNDERPYVHACTKYHVWNDLIRGKPDKNPIEKKDTEVSAVLSTELHTNKTRATKNQKFTVEETKDAYCSEASKQVGMSRSTFQATRNGILLLTPKINCCLRKLVPVSLREPTCHAER